MPLFHNSPSHLPKKGTPSHGLAQTPQGITVHGHGPVQTHLTFPALILITPLDEEDASDFIPVTYADLVSAQKEGAWRAEGIPAGTPLPRPGAISRGWWVSKGVLMSGFGRVVNVFEHVSVAWVDDSAMGGKSKEDIDREVKELWSW